MSQHQEQIRRVVGAIRTGVMDSDQAHAALSKIPPDAVAWALIDTVCRADGARALFCDPDGLVDGQEPGWFDVEGYSTRARWEGTETNDGGLDGFKTLEAAIEYAQDASMAGFYEVVVTAYGSHELHESGERVWSKHHRPYAGDTPADSQPITP